MSQSIFIRPVPLTSVILGLVTILCTGVQIICNPPPLLLLASHVIHREVPFCIWSQLPDPKTGAVGCVPEHGRADEPLFLRIQDWRFQIFQIEHDYQPHRPQQSQVLRIVWRGLHLGPWSRSPKTFPDLAACQKTQSSPAVIVLTTDQ